MKSQLLVVVVGLALAGCTAGRVGEACNSASECETWRCRQRRCAACTEDSQCESQMCIKGICAVSGCKHDAHCGVGELCDLRHNVCFKPLTPPEPARPNDYPN